MTPPSLDIRLFGPYRVMIHGDPMPPVRTRSIGWLLALMVLRHGRSVSRSWLAGMLWPESDEPRALQNLRNVLVSLRKAMGPESRRIRTPTRDTLAIDLSDEEADVLRFDAAIRQADDESLRRAVETYTGPLLEGCYEEWALVEREARAGQCLAALETLAARAEERGDPFEAIRYLRRAESLDPLRNQTVQRLMANLAASGDPAAAIEVYRTFRFRLHEQQDRPNEATMSLFYEIRAAARDAGVPAGSGVRRLPPGCGVGQGAPSALRRAPVPCPLTPLIGREREIREVREQVGTYRLVTLVGGGGVGKTRLALETVRQADGGISDGAVWVELAPLTDGTRVLSSIAEATGLPEEGSSHPVTLRNRLISRLSEDCALLVLDNCEHLLGAVAEIVHTLLMSCPALHILATSRQRLGLAGEVAWRVPSLSVPDPEQLPENPEGGAGGALHYAAIRLFVERAAAAREGFRLADRDTIETVCRICRRLDGIPLAIELAAARVRVLTPQQIAARLDDRFALLTTGARSALPRHQTLRALIDWSYDQLPQTERILLCRLSVFAGGWTLEAAEAVVGAGIAVGGDRSATTAPHVLLPSGVLDALDSLAERSFVLIDEIAGGLRYRMLETVREYAREKLRDGGEEVDARRRHAGYHARQVIDAPKPHDPAESIWFDRCEIEHENLHAALDWYLLDAHQLANHINRQNERSELTSPVRAASFSDRTIGRHMAVGLARYWFVRGHIAEGRTYLEIALSRIDDPSETASQDLISGVIASGEGAASDVSGEAHAREPDPDLRARLLQGAGHLALAQSDFAAARSYYQGCLAIYERRSDLRGVLTGVLYLGEMEELAGNPAEARSFFKRGLALAQQLGDRRSTAESLHGLGVVAELEGDYARATGYFERSVPIAREIGADGWAAWGLHAHGFAAWQLGDLSAGRTWLAESLDLFRRMGHRYGVARSLERFAGLALAVNEPVRAAKLAAAAERLRETIGAPLGPQGQAEYERDVDAMRAALSASQFGRLWTEGRAMALEQAIDEALSLRIIR